MLFPNANDKKEESDMFGPIFGQLEINVWRGDSPKDEEDRRKRSHDGYLKQTLRMSNMTVANSRKLVTHLLTGIPSPQTIDVGEPPVSHPLNSTASAVITQMRWGTGGIGPGDIILSPTVNDTQLNSPITTPAYAPVTFDFPDETTVRFTASLGQGDANGQAISEEGLFAAGEGGVPHLFAKRTFGVLTKTPEFSFEFRHSIIL